MLISRALRVAAFLVIAAGGRLSGQQSIEPALRAQLQSKAGHYPLRNVTTFSQDSVLLVFDDSTLTAASLKAGTWMFGPPVTAAEADSCRPEKVLGRKIARVFWRGVGKPSSLQQIVVRVRGTVGIDRWTSTDLYYYRAQLEGPWAGDPGSR